MLTKVVWSAPCTVILLLFASFSSNANDLKRDTVYQIVTDRFFDGDTSNNDPPQSPGIFDPTRKKWRTYWGGDLEGIRQKLSYLAGLGVTAIWISPPVDNINANIVGTGSFYGYQARDFKRIEEHFGDAANSWAAFDNLVAAAHERGIKVIVDFAPNHSSIHIVGEFGALYDDGVFLADFNHDPKGYFHRYGFIADADDPYETQYFSLFGLADINQDNPTMDAYLKSAAQTFQQHGADGFRIDGVKHVSWGWMYSFANSLYTDGNSFVFGEWYLENTYDPLFWDYAFANSIYSADAIFPFPETMQPVVSDPLYHDAYKFANKSGISLADFPLSSAIRNVFGTADADFHEIDSVIASMSEDFSDPDSLVTFIDNHDLKRFLSTQPSLDRHHESLAFLLTARGIPCLYYGAEQYLHDDTNGGRDPYNRPMMNSFSTTTIAYSLISKLSALRRDNPAVAYGSLKRRWINHDVYVYEREFFGSVVLVAINKSGTDSYAIADLRTALPPGSYADYLGGQLNGLPIKVGAGDDAGNGVEGFTLLAHTVSVWSRKGEASKPQVGSVSPRVGQPGMHVTISGEGFGPEAGEVKFGAASAKVASWGETEISVIVPAIPSVQSGVWVNTRSGQTSNDVQFTVLTARLVPVVFNLTNTPRLNPADRLFVVGDGVELGSWKATYDDAPGPLLTRNGTDWFLCVALPARQEIQFKFVVISESGGVRWSPSEVQTYLVPASGVGRVDAVWK